MFPLCNRNLTITISLKYALDARGQIKIWESESFIPVEFFLKLEGSRLKSDSGVNIQLFYKNMHFAFNEYNCYMIFFSSNYAL